MKPGDIIEWRYTHSGQTAIPGETMRSAVTNQTAYVGGDELHVVVDVTKATLTWMNSRGVHKALIDPKSPGSGLQTVWLIGLAYVAPHVVSV